MSKNFNINVSTDFKQIPADKPFSMRVMLTAEGTADPGKEKKRKPLHIALVLDRSGSMSGNKIAHVKEAVLELVKLLDPEDVISLTTFDDQVKTVVKPTRVEQLEAIEQTVRRIQPGGCTNLHGGYKQGCDLAIEHASPEFYRRVILLTDGLANEGLTDPDALADFASDMQEQGITTTTIGVGSGYNELLLGKIAENGGGGTYFIERPEDAVPVFTREMKNLKSVVATDLTVSLEKALPGVKFEQLNTYRKLSEGEYLLGEVYSGQPRRILFEARVPVSPLGEELELVSMKATWKEDGGKGTRLRQKTFKVKVTPVEAKDFAGIKGDREVLLEAAFLSIAWANRKAIELSDRGQFEKAAAKMKKVAAELEKMNLEDEDLTREIEDLKTRAEELGTRGEIFYDAIERKRIHTEHLMTTQSNRESMYEMKMRRIYRDDYQDGRPGFRYTCYEVDGHVLAEIGNDRVLLDTGGALSFGENDSLRLGDRMFPLKDEFIGADALEISRLIGTRITALVGADILNQLNFSIDLGRGRFASSDSRPRPGRGVMPFRCAMNVPVVDVEVGGRRMPMFFDTGAKVSYLPRELFPHYDATETRSDFYYGFGEFETPVTRLRVGMADEEMEVEFGVLPRQIEAIVSKGGAQGILGSEVLNRFRLQYWGPEKTIALRPL